MSKIKFPLNLKNGNWSSTKIVNVLYKFLITHVSKLNNFFIHSQERPQSSKMDTSEDLASKRSMSSQPVAGQATPTRTCFKRRSCDAALMLECLGNEQHMLTSSIEGVLWSDEEETEYFYKEEAASVWSQGTIFIILTSLEFARMIHARLKPVGRDWLRCFPSLVRGFEGTAFIFSTVKRTSRELVIGGKFTRTRISTNSWPLLVVLWNSLLNKYSQTTQ